MKGHYESCLVSLAAVLAVAAFRPACGAAASCESLRHLTLHSTTITLAQAIPAGDFKTPTHNFKNLPAFCRVAGVIKPTSDSEIKFEVWMPASAWNKRFQAVGNGGFAGSINYGGLAGALRSGFATASTDTGHAGSSIDTRWAPGHPQKVIDFGYRGVHQMTIQAKTIIAAFYGAPPRRSYFASCSNGGRQALMEAQRFPSDYNGIIAGAPANNWTLLQAGAVWGIQATLDNPASYIPASKLPAISAAVLAACDANDGVTDGVLNDPLRCHFNPTTLLCTGAESDSCLTAPQVAALRKIYSGPQTSSGRPIFPGYEPGGELGPNGWAGWITGSAPKESLGFKFGTQFFSNMVFDNPSWDFHSFNFNTDIQTTNEKLAHILNATNPDLQSFESRGGKLIMYHGWSDAAIPPLSTVDYYNRVVAAMGFRQTEAFLRLFMVPGMQHCGGGPGPGSFGSEEAEAGSNPADNMFEALERWVEDGVAPEKIIATKYQKPDDHASGVVMTRPLCAYPDVAKYKGSGNSNDAASFACVNETGR